jgi:hypothetical protein
MRGGLAAQLHLRPTAAAPAAAAAAAAATDAAAATTAASKASQLLLGRVVRKQHALSGASRCIKTINLARKARDKHMETEEAFSAGRSPHRCGLLMQNL